MGLRGRLELHCWCIHMALISGCPEAHTMRTAQPDGQGARQKDTEPALKQLLLRGGTVSVSQL